MSSFLSRLEWAEDQVRGDPERLAHEEAVREALEGIVATLDGLLTDDEWGRFLALVRQDRRCHDYYAPNLCRAWWDCLVHGWGRLPGDTDRAALVPILDVLLNVSDGPDVEACASCGLPRPVKPALPWSPCFVPPGPCDCWSCTLYRDPPKVQLPAELLACPACGCPDTDGRECAPWRSLPGVVPWRLYC
jgi:hypothetical protein